MKNEINRALVAKKKVFFALVAKKKVFFALVAKKKVLLFAALTLSAGLWALDDVHYMDADGQEQTVNNVTEIMNSSTTLNAGWYVVNGEVQTGTLVCKGEVHLILADGAKLAATGKGDPNYTPGIQVSGENNSLTIYGQAAQTGQLIAKGGKWASGIGGGKTEEGHNITINGGAVTAIGYTSAGIGGGYGGNGSDITINGGTVKATGGQHGAGIGGGDRGNGSDITINGGAVTATGGDYATGIGGGDRGTGSNITINGGTVKANAGASNTIAIGNGYQATKAAANIFVATKCTLKAGTSTPLTDDNLIIHISTDDIASLLANKRYATVAGPAMVPSVYVDENGVSRNASAYVVADSVSQVIWGIDGETVWYVVNAADVQLAEGAVCVGDVRLILADGAKLTAIGKGEPDYTPGIQVSGEENSFTVYAQSAQTGQLIANGGYYAAGIGGGTDEGGNNITIHSGVVTANGGYMAAGIGGGYRESGYNIIINGGTVTANGGYRADGIGEGFRSEAAYACNVYISDAYVLYVGESETLTDDDIVEHSSATDMGSTLTQQQYVKMEGLATPYIRTTTSGNWATVCLPYAATSLEGANFYKINYCDGNGKLYIEEVSALEAGMPYIFEATDETVSIYHDATSPMIYNEQTERGLHGALARKVIESDGFQAALSEGQVVVVENGYTLTIPACRAYMDMSEVPTTEQYHQAPLRCIGVPHQTPMGLIDVNNSVNVSKFIKDGQLIIVKDGKTYNIQGIEIR